MHTLTWNQVHTWRLTQHGLTPRISKEDWVQIVTRIGGFQAQVMSAAELALCSRVEGLSAQDIKSALWQDHTLIKTWAMRGTLHLLPATELPLYVAARNWQLDTSWSRYFAEFGLSSQAQQEAYLAAIPHVLEQGPMTRQQLADAVAKHTRIALVRDLIVSANWGSPLKPSAYRGDLCFGPSQGSNVTFVHPKTWISNWSAQDTLEQEQALKRFVRLYLQAYGPALPEDFARWWGGNLSHARKLFRSMQDEVKEVEIEGQHAFALDTTLKHIQNAERSEVIHFLPLFDVYTIGVGRTLGEILPPIHKKLVFRPQGWISAVILVNGSIQGVWQSSPKRSQIHIKVHMFPPQATSIEKRIKAEADRLRSFYQKDIHLEFRK
ncbi:winged helix DNA-binding domain-containing protein [Ktedonospora formicarum]|uniref:Winged helix DNA-binding domain-containing protein n=1 Tax=Ktedonospora formicarum TaxID=2778364 RepID=A0A8J3I6B4_9CHLR|nr:winged helix DNA-binding domain-containing protein [Ktedonospora formicarum]GHO46882.1 hypothetical protein KSX_50450 [Ktedonospora formicarum]